LADAEFDRRDFLKTAVVGGVAAGTAAAIVPEMATAQGQSVAPAPVPGFDGYSFLNLEEGAFVEAVADHMVPEDALTPKGTAIGIHIYIDRALSGGWGKGEKLYRQGPWPEGEPSQGYQLPLTPAELYRAGIRATNAHCMSAYGRNFDRLEFEEKEAVLLGLSSGEIDLGNAVLAREFWNVLYQTVMEGMFSDPIYGGNRGKAGWALIGFPGIIAVHRENVKNYRDRPYSADPFSISDLS
jgi:gluconate 2-dehydrogenase gamma chain